MLRLLRAHGVVVRRAGVPRRVLGRFGGGGEEARVAVQGRLLLRFQGGELIVAIDRLCPRALEVLGILMAVAVEL